MLELRPTCECCNKNLPAYSSGAVICSYECTFCVACAEGVLGGICPNCGGDFTPRPIRTKEELKKHPASTKQIHNPALGLGYS